MILAVMQPYLFPYIGYYQLAYHSDFFIFYDDVNYIKNGYINRNTILTKNGRQLFTIPVNKASSFSKINELEFSINVKKVLISISQAYSKAPYFETVYPIIEKIFNSEDRNISIVTSSSIIEVFKYLDIEFPHAYSSMIDYDRTQDAENKLYELCHIYSADQYVNTIGGQSLYEKDRFLKKGIKLEFINSRPCNYSQFNSNYFEENLSIIDILMNVSPEKIKKLLGLYHVE